MKLSDHTVYQFPLAEAEPGPDLFMYMIAADLNLAQADLELAGKMARERILSELLENYKSVLY